MAKDQRLSDGSLIGSYTIVRLIEKGGMGEVYEAYEPVLERKVALKIISNEIAEEPENIRLFISEGKTLAQLNHRNVVTIYNLGQDKGIYFIAMEFVEGDSLQVHIRRKSLNVERSLHIFKQVLQGTSALHAKGIVHRDLKPRNIIVNKEKVVKIVDFGIAQLLRGTQPNFGESTAIVGSPHYMAPEVIQGEQATFQSDIWSLGIIFYEMLTNQRPFIGKTRHEVMENITSKELKFSISDKLLLPTGLQEIVYKMCFPFLHGRYQTIADVLTDIENYEQSSSIENTNKSLALSSSMKIKDTTRTPFPPITEYVRKPPKKKKSRFKGAVYAISIGFLGLFLYAHFVRQETALPDLAFTNFNDPELNIPQNTQQVTPPPVAVQPPVQIQPTAPVPVPAPVPTPAPTPTPVQGQAQNRAGSAAPPTTPNNTPAQARNISPPQHKATRTVVTKPKPVEISSLAAPRPLNGNRKVVLQFKINRATRSIASLNKSKIINPPVFQWAKVKNAQYYELQISDSEDFEKLKLNTKVRSNAYKWVSVTPGQFYWRVRAHDSKQNPGAYSATEELEISLPATKFFKSLYLTYEKRTSSGRPVISPVTVSWTPVPLADGYFIVLSRDEKLEDRLWSTTLNNTQTNIRLPASGQFFAAVTAVNKSPQAANSFSNPVKIQVKQEIKIPLPTLEIPANGIQVPTQGSMLVPIVFKWSVTASNQKFRIQLSTDPNFTEILHESETAQNQYLLSQPLPKGKIYWRVQASVGQNSTTWTNPQFFEIQ